MPAYNGAMRTFLIALLVPALAVPATQAAKPAAAPCRPAIRDAWVRLPPGMPMGAGYFVIDNVCSERVVMTGASSDRFADVSMHETRVDAGVSRMKPIDRVRVAPRSRAVFAPGGRHLMLMAPRGAVAAGDRVRLELSFDDGSRVAVLAPVRNAAP